LASSRRTPNPGEPAIAFAAEPATTTATPPIDIAGEMVPAGERRSLEIPVARLASGAWVKLPLVVVHGAKPGKWLWLSAAIHGDELNGVETIRRVLAGLDARALRGVVVAVPVVNVFGFLEQSRYLPDRRDLNRSFPGSPRGSMASQLAHLFMREVVARCEYGIDLHTGSAGRKNLPQIRADLSDPEARRCALAFGAPVALHARLRDGSLREAAVRRGIHTLLYEAGEALRFDRRSIEIGVAGIRRVMAMLEMVDDRQPAGDAPLELPSSRWIRAAQSGLLWLDVELGDRVQRGQVVGTISDVVGATRLKVRAHAAGIVIGLTTNPLVNRGDAILHVADISTEIPTS
jgi:uncharacterized protein